MGIWIDDEGFEFLTLDHERPIIRFPWESPYSRYGLDDRPETPDDGPPDREPDGE